MQDLPYSLACERNQKFILPVLKETFKQVTNVLEIGSGTGQHAVYMSKYLAHLSWFPTDLQENIETIQSRVIGCKHKNLKKPIHLDVNKQPWLLNTNFDGIFSANTLHILSSDGVISLFKGASLTLSRGGVLCIYGPFKYNNNYLSLNDQRFDQSLKLRQIGSCIKDFEAITELAAQAGFKLVDDYTLPANNHLLYWLRQ